MNELPNSAQVEGFFNATKKYDVETITSAVTDVMPSMTGIKNKIHDFGKDMSSTEGNKPAPQYQSKDEMIKIVMDFFRSVDPRLAERIEGVLKDSTIDKRIELIDEGKSSGKVTPEGDGLKIEIKATKDAGGLVAIAQELASAYVYQKYLINEREEARKRREFVAKTAKKFIASLMLKHLIKNSLLTEEQADKLENDMLRETTDSIEELESSTVDREIFAQICEDNPGAFENSLGNYSEDNFKRSMDRLAEKGLSSDLVTRRIKEVAEQGKTPMYLMGDVTAQLAAYKMQDMFIKNHDQAMTDMLSGIEAGNTLSQITHMSNSDLITECAHSDMMKEVVENSRNPQMDQDLSDPTASQEMVMEMQRRKLN